MRSIFSFARSLRTAALDVLYPPGCAACDDPVGEDACFCGVCAQSLVAIERPCPGCALPRLDAQAPCPACRLSPLPLDEVHAAYAFGGPLADALRLLKFSARIDLGERMGALLADAFAYYHERLGDPLVLPVPLSRRRLATRGYNQAALLALGAAQAAMPLYACLPARRSLDVRTDLLRRIRETPAQVGRGAAARRAALIGAFAATTPLTGRSVILVDDVMTTGATLAACADAVRAAGASYVVALTVGRALP